MQIHRVIPLLGFAGANLSQVRVPVADLCEKVWKKREVEERLQWTILVTKLLENVSDRLQPNYSFTLLFVAPMSHTLIRQNKKKFLLTKIVEPSYSFSFHLLPAATIVT